MDIIEFLINYIEVIIFLIIVLFFILRAFIKKVPYGTVVIIDRNGHYLKTVRFGFYLFNPITDKITTEISTKTCTKNYTNIFETYDGQFIKLSFLVKYKTENIEATLKALEDSRRSIDDVINCSVYNVLNSLNAADIIHKVQLKQDLKQKASFDATSLSFILEDLYINSIVNAKTATQNDLFKPHISSSSGPIKYC